MLLADTGNQVAPVILEAVPHNFTFYSSGNSFKIYLAMYIYIYIYIYIIPKILYILNKITLLSELNVDGRAITISSVA